MNKLRIAIGADHAGFNLKEKLKGFLFANNFEFKDFGTFSEDRADYPDFAHPVAKAVLSPDFDFGVLVCGSGNGVNIAANKHQGIRSALCWNIETAALARQHNNANIIALPARFIDDETAFKMVFTFLSTDFEGGRHQARVDKIDC